ncbi:hypothetical protein RCH14_002393 [Massilia sp. MP_M2]|uniref:DUF6064 family protein n=1 Tax=Massilia sp. MP_M2 TaxID=3071713 RepID=UPI00319EAD1F
MSEWWTYSLSDFLMFSSRSYYRLIESCNAAIWPAHLLALVAGVIVINAIARPSQHTQRVAALVLAGAWGWVAWAYHLERYAEINTAAPYFAAAFLVQALLLCWLAFRPGNAAPAPRRVALGLTGLAIVAYPLLALARDGGEWRQAEVFGIAPDPTVIVTLGVLLAWRAHAIFWLIPVSWCLVSGATLMELKVGHAWLLPALALTAVLARVMGSKKPRDLNSTANPRS